MKNERLIHAIGMIDDDLIFNAVNDVKAGKREDGLNGESLRPACASLS